MSGGTDTAEYQTVIKCGNRIKIAVQNNLGDIADRAVASRLITPANGGELRNRFHTEAVRASTFLELLQLQVQNNERNYWLFVDDVLGGDRFFYRHIIDHLKSEYDKMKAADETVKPKPPNSSSNGVEKEERVQADDEDTDLTPEIPKYDEREAKVDFDLVPDGHKLKELQSYAEEVEFILHTVNNNELKAVLGEMGPPDIDGFAKPTNLDIIPFKIILGKFGGYKVAQVKTKMGADCEKEVKEALKRLPSVRAVIAVGVAYGSDRKKHKFGDVLVSIHIHGVKNTRLQPDGIITRPSNLSTVQIADYLSDVFTTVPDTWREFQCNKITDSDPKPRYAQVHCGSIISGPMLVAHDKSRDALSRNYPSGTIGGEMEGWVLLKIQDEHNADRGRRHNLDVIIIKAVADFGDDQKQEGKKWQYTAALAATSYIKHKLSMTKGMLFTEVEPENAED